MKKIYEKLFFPLKFIVNENNDVWAYINPKTIQILYQVKDIA